MKFEKKGEGVYCWTCCGYVCPHPQLYTKKALEKMKEGELLELVFDNPPPGESIAAMCDSIGNEVVEKTDQAANTPGRSKSGGLRKDPMNKTSLWIVVVVTASLDRVPDGLRRVVAYRRRQPRPAEGRRRRSAGRGRIRKMSWDKEENYEPRTCCCGWRERQPGLRHGLRACSPTGRRRP